LTAAQLVMVNHFYISKDDEIYQKGIDEVRNIQINESKTEESNRITFQNIIQRMGKTRKRKKKKYRFKEIQSGTKLTNEPSYINEEEQNLEYK
jgi:uncharacterized protein (DUF885 family)